MVELEIPRKIAEKLAHKHSVSVPEIYQLWMNRMGRILMEHRERNQGRFPRYWFLSETDAGRRLKVVFTEDPNFEAPVIITVHPPTPEAEVIYEKENR